LPTPLLRAVTFALFAYTPFFGVATTRQLFLFHWIICARLELTTQSSPSTFAFARGATSCLFVAVSVATASLRARLHFATDATVATFALAHPIHASSPLRADLAGLGSWAHSDSALRSGPGRFVKGLSNFSNALAFLVGTTGTVATALLSSFPTRARGDAAIFTLEAIQARADAFLANAHLRAVIGAASDRAASARITWLAKAGTIDAVSLSVAVIRAHDYTARRATETCFAVALTGLAIAQATLRAAAVAGASPLRASLAGPQGIAHTSICFSVTLTVSTSIRTFLYGFLYFDLHTATGASPAVRAAATTRGALTVTTTVLRVTLVGSAVGCRPTRVAAATSFRANSVPTAITGTSSSSAGGWQPTVLTEAARLLVFAHANAISTTLLHNTVLIHAIGASR